MRQGIGIYRGKRVEKGHEGEWAFGALILGHEHTPFILTEEEMVEDVGGLLDDSQMYQVDPETVGECIGISDHKGNLLYEGDIICGLKPESETVNSGPESAIGVIVWHYTAFGIPWLDEKSNVFHVPGWDKSKYIALVGNVWDNPELVEKCGYKFGDEKENEK